MTDRLLSYVVVMTVFPASTATPVPTPMRLFAHATNGIVMQQTRQTNVSFASSFFSTQQGIVPLNISIPMERMMKPPSCSHDHLLSPSPNLSLTPRLLAYCGLNWWMTTEVPHTRKVRKGSSRLRMTELVYCVSLSPRSYQRDTHRAEVEEQQHDDGGDVQPQHGGTVLARRHPREKTRTT